MYVGPLCVLRGFTRLPVSLAVVSVAVAASDVLQLPWLLLVPVTVHVASSS